MAREDKNGIIVPLNFIETAQGLQQLLADTPFEARHAEAQKAIDLLGPTKEYAGTRTVIVHALSSYIVLDCMDRVEVDTLPQEEMIVRGNIGGVAYLEDGLAMSSLCVALRSSTVLWRRQSTAASRKRIDDDLYVPVFAVESIWAAA
jgi:hypothetical protein